jgi:hypothetical protein
VEATLPTLSDLPNVNILLRDDFEDLEFENSYNKKLWGILGSNANTT